MKRGCLYLLAVPVVAFLAYVVLIPLVFGPQKNRIDRENRANGDRVVAALQQYEARYHKYPDALDKLAPEFLATVPQARSSSGEPRAFAYSSDGKQFELTYPEASYGPMAADADWQYRSQTREWEHKMY